MIKKALPLYTALALACLTLTSHAQSGKQFTVYGMITVEQLSGIHSSPLLATLSPAPCTGNATTSVTCTQYNNSVHPIGFTGGGTYKFMNLGPAALSFDLRGVVESDRRGAPTAFNGPGTRIYSGLGGVRATFRTPIKILAPYVQGSAGYGRSNYGVLTNAAVAPSSTTSTTLTPGVPTQGNFEYHAFVGLDIRLFSALDFRLFEAGYGALQAFGAYSHSYPLYSFSSGLVFHIPPRDAQ